MSNEELYEYYGWKAHKYGFFIEWQNKTSDAMSKNPKLERSIISQDVFVNLMKETVKVPTEGVYSPSQN
jgi:hypothetical protein